MSRELEAALRELGLAPGATPREVERARRALALAWHPDRFHGDPTREREAEERLRRVNAAFRTLAEHGFPTDVPVASSRPGVAPSGTGKAARDRLVRRPSRGWRAAWWSAVFGLLTFAYVTSNESRRPAAASSRGVEFAGPVARALQPPRPEARPRRDARRGDRALGIAGSAPPPEAPAPWAPPARPSPPPRSPFFTLGASKEEVYAIQGSPRVATEERWSYGYSYVDFDDDRVVGWYDSRAEALRARLVPRRPGAAAPFFTVGSTKDDVLRVQGSPRRFSDDRWEYGYSFVEFEGDRVVRWYDSRAHALRARLVPAEGVVAPPYFTVGSTKDEVLLVQGSPPRFDDRRWEYGYSFVEFDEAGRVVDWHDSGQRPLLARRF